MMPFPLAMLSFSSTLPKWHPLYDNKPIRYRKEETKMKKVLQLLNDAIAKLGLYQGEFLIELPAKSQK